MPLSQVLSRFAVGGTSNVGGDPDYENYLPRMNSLGILDASLLPADEQTGYVEKTGAYTLSVSDFTVNATSGTFALTLPTAVGVAGKQYFLKNSGNGVVTVETTSSQTVDGLASGSLILNEFSGILVQSTNANWILLSQSGSDLELN